MKKAINILSITGIVSALIIIFFLYVPKTKAKATFDDFPIGQSRSIDIQVNQDVLGALTNRERLDQMRDWLLFTIVSNSGLSAQEINKTLYDLPPIRYGYMQPIANFEYEDTRSRYVGEGIVVAAIPAGSAEHRIERLARIADESRKNTGEIPDTIEVFEYKIDMDDQSAEVTRRESIKGKELFTEKYGYVEKKISSLDDLSQFMQQADDITYATASGSVTLGGRKIKGHPYRGIRVEDVAAIWQSENKIQSQGNPVKQKIEGFNNKWKERTYRTQIDKASLEAQYKREEEQLKKEIKQLQKDSKGKLADGSGFSLDPTFDFEGLKKYFDSKVAPAFNYDTPIVLPYSFQVGSTASKEVSTKEVSEALARHDSDPLYDFLENLSKKQPESAASLMSYIRYKYSFQEARYDGYIEGTEVGMVLFYTDLLAKLWALDYLSNAPNRYIEDFSSLTQISVSPIYRKEVEELSRTRLWFGPQDKGFQVLDGGDGITFARNATRVYAASATALQPGKESEAAPDSEAFLGWWNEHYEEIARYEPQYQRLNEIMKWSLLIGWLNNSHKGQQLDFLGGVKVEHSNWFPQWVKQQPDLRFKHWGDACASDSSDKAYDPQMKVCFFPKSYKDSKYESLPLLVSKLYKTFGKDNQLSGGVSLAEKGLFTERLPLSSGTKIESLMRRSNLKYESGLTGERLSTFEGVKYNFKTVTADSAELTSTAKMGAKLRGRYGEMAPDLEFQRTLAQKGGDFSLQTKAGGADLGTLNIQKTGNGFSVGWRSREIDHAQILARQMSRSEGPSLSIIKNNPNVESFIQMPSGEQYMVKFQGSDRWIKLGPEKMEATPYEWKSRVADLAPESKSYDISWLKSDEIKSALSKDRFLVIHQEEAGLKISLSESASGAAREPVAIQIDGLTVKGLKNPATGEVRFACKDLPDSVLVSPDKLGRAIVGKAPHESQMAQSLRSGNYDGIVQDILRSPGDVSRVITQEYANGIKVSNQMLANKQYTQALREYNLLISAYGPQPELVLGKGLAQIGDRSPTVARAIEETIGSGGSSSGADFLSEINARLSRNGIAPPGDIVSIVSNGRKVSLSYELSKFPSGSPVSPDSISRGDFILLVEDSPGLNNMNWDVSINRTIEEAVSLNIGEFRVADINLADLRPSMFMAPAKPATASHQAVQSVSFRPHYFRSVSVPGGIPNNDDEEKKKRKAIPVYVVLAKDAATI